MTISVITATYNRCSTLATTFESILSQDYTDYEYILVDGGSTDGTIELIRHYEPRFGGRMRWISEPDRGLYDAMNKGIRMATGEVVGILNSDDFFSAPDILSTIAEAMSDSSIDAIYADVHFVRPSDLSMPVRYYSSRSFRPSAFRFGYMPAHPSFYARRKLFEQYGYYSLDYKLSADFDLMLRFMLIHHIQTRYIERDFVTMRTGGLTHHHRFRLTMEDVRACRANGIYTSILLCSLRYWTKIIEYFI